MFHAKKNPINKTHELKAIRRMQIILDHGKFYHNALKKERLNKLVTKVRRYFYSDLNTSIKFMEKIGMIFGFVRQKR